MISYLSTIYKFQICQTSKVHLFNVFIFFLNILNAFDYYFKGSTAGGLKLTINGQGFLKLRQSGEISQIWSHCLMERRRVLESQTP